MMDSGRSPSGRATRASTEPQSSVRLGHTASVPNAARVIDIINSADASAARKEYAAHYSDDDLTPEAWARFRATMNSKIGVQGATGMRVVLRWVEEKWSEHPGCGEDEEYVDVGGADDEADNWSLSFTPWGEWKLLPVEDRTGKGLTTDQIAAHLFYEITWHGSEEDASDRLIHVKDLADKAMDEIERGAPKGA